MAKLIVSLDSAPTDNRRLMPAWNRRGLIATPEYRSWKERTVIDLRMQWGKRSMIFPTYESQIPYLVKVFMSSKRTDQVNWDKAVRDAITAAEIWEDDRWTYPIYSPCEIDKLNPRMEIDINENGLE